MHEETEGQSCELPTRGIGWVGIASWISTSLVSAALFSLFFWAEGSLAWLGVLGFVPIGLRRMGCQTCGSVGQSPSNSAWPGH